MTYIFLILAVCLFFLVIEVYQYLRDQILLRRVTSLDRGTESERRLILKLLKMGIPASCIYHDLYLETSPGKYSQIDVAAVTASGIIVFEVKDYSGKIYGAGYSTYWAEYMNGEKYKFYNPVMQNASHMRALRKEVWNLGRIPLFSVVVFFGDCKLKKVDAIPEGVRVVYSRHLRAAVSEILSGNSRASYFNRTQLDRVLHQAVENGDDEEIRNRHIENVRRLTRPNIFIRILRWLFA